MQYVATVPVDGRPDERTFVPGVAATSIREGPSGELSAVSVSFAKEANAADVEAVRRALEADPLVLEVIELFPGDFFGTCTDEPRCGRAQRY